jgi:hypothetical protein
MSEFGADHGQISVEFLRRSREYLANGMLLQASEKGWGAVAHAAKLFAESCDGLEYERHERLDEVVTEMGIATNNHRQISWWARSANHLHRNFYDDDFDADTIAAYLDDVANFVNLVRELTGLTPAES